MGHFGNQPAGWRTAGVAQCVSVAKSVNSSAKRWCATRPLEGTAEFTNEIS